MSDTTEADRPAHGLTRQDLVRRGAAGAGGLLLAGSLAGVAEAAIGATPKPKRGGTFRFGAAGGSAKDYIDGQSIISEPDIARQQAGWETLMVYDSNYKLAFDGLAEEITPNKRGDVWTIRVRDGIEFHNGKTLNADDVRYSLQRFMNKKLGLGGVTFLASMDPARMKKLDRRTLRCTLKQRDGTLLDSFAQYTGGIVPAGYSPGVVGKANPNVGTGPYKLQSFTPGRQSVHVRHPNYWRTGQPYFDRVVVIDFPEETARMNALLGGQVDAATSVPAAQVGVINGHAGTKVLQTPSGIWTPIMMRVDQAPFNDVRVRQAMRLIVNRPQMVAQALAGFGRVGNDLYAPLDEAYNSSLPQRRQDIEKAKSLLKSAGQEGLTAELVTAAGTNGMVECAQVFAQQAKAAGVTINVKVVDTGTLWGDEYLKWVFSTDFWNTRNYMPQVASGSLPTSPYNQTHWPDAANQRFVSLYNQAKATPDRKKRIELMHEMQKLEYEAGGNIIWGFQTALDAYSTKVKGLRASYKSILRFNQYGRGFQNLWFA